MVVPADVSGVFWLAVQNLNAITERDSAVGARPEALERVLVVREISTASLAGWPLKKMDMARKFDEARAMAVHLNTDRIELHEQVFANASGQSELCDPQDPSSSFEAWGKSAHEHPQSH